MISPRPQQPAPVSLATAAELIAIRIGGLLERRLSWLAEARPDRLEDERAWQAGVVLDAAIDQRLAGPEARAWARLTTLFALSPAEADLLAVAVAIATEPALGPMIARAQGIEGRRLPAGPLVKRPFAHPPPPVR